MALAEIPSDKTKETSLDVLKARLGADHPVVQRDEGVTVEDVMIEAFKRKDHALISECIPCVRDINYDRIQQEACHAFDLDTYKLLCPAGLTPDGGSEICPILSTAVCKKRLDFMKYLLDHGATPSYPLFWGYMSALWMSISQDYMDGLKLLIEYGGYWKSENSLRAAAHFGRLEMVKYLLELGADINDWEKGIFRRDRTPLFCAVVKNHFEVAKYLLDNGADPTIAQEDGSPLDKAIQKGHTEMIELLKQRLELKSQEKMGQAGSSSSGAHGVSSSQITSMKGSSLEG